MARGNDVGASCRVNSVWSKRGFHEVMLPLSRIKDNTPAECRGLSYPAFMARFPTILGHLIANEEGRYLTIAGSS
jgi:hypothetical protein